MAVRRSTAATSVRRAGTTGAPARSVRRNTIPWPGGAGRNVASVSAPVCSPCPDTDARCRMERLLMGLLLAPYQRLEVVDDLCQPVQRPLGAQELAVAPGRIPRDRRPWGDVADHAPLHRHPRPPADGDVVSQSRLPRQEHIVLDVRAARDPRLPRDQAARPDPAVVSDLHEVVDLRSGAETKIDNLVQIGQDRKSTRLNSSHGYISYAVFCLKKKKIKKRNT